MKNNLKKKNLKHYLPILLLPLLLLASCSKEDIPLPQPKPIEPPVVVIKKSDTLYSQSYLNQKSGIFFIWHYNIQLTSARKILNNDEKGDYGAGQSYSDVNGDGFVDILTSYSNDAIGYKGIRWYINKGDNKNFYSDTTYINGNTFGSTAHKVLKTDINKDGKADFVILGVDERVVGNYNGNFNVLLSTTTNKFQYITIPNPNKYWFHNGATGDLNGDGNVDVVAGTFVWYGDGSGNFTKSNIELNKYTSAILVYEILDIDKDGKDDIIIGGNDVYGNTTIIFNNGTFINSKTIQFKKQTEFLFCIDFEFIDLDSDGDLDIVELRADKDQIQTKLFAYIKTGDGYSLDPAYFNDSLDGGSVYGQYDKYGWSTFKVDDVDGDKILDIVAENFHDSQPNGYKKVGGNWVKFSFN
jgi:hypothetical protein